MKRLLPLCLMAAACCSSSVRLIPSVAVSKASSAKELRAKTVALVQLSDTKENGVAVYCSGVWVSDTSIITAHHCTDNSPIGTAVSYVIDTDIFRDDGYTLRAAVQPRPAVVYDTDPKHDLSLLRVGKSPLGHKVSRLGSNKLQAGDYAEVMGHSVGLWWSYSSGDIAAIRRIEVGDEYDPEFIFVQTTAPISPGNSGGGLFDSNGDLIGICHARLARGENLNIFVHVNYVQALLTAQGDQL